MASERVPELQVSVSQIKTYLRCPESYRLRYVIGEPPAFVPVPFAFGLAFHAALAAYYSAIRTTGTVPSVDRVQSVFLESWGLTLRGPVPLQLDEEDGDAAVEDLAAKGKEMLALFHKHAAAQPIPVVEHIEKRFLVPLYDPETGEVLDEKLAGVIDLAVREDGHLVIVEHKTAAKKWSFDQLRYDLQPTAYYYAAEMLGWGEVGLRFDIVTKAKKPVVQVENVLRDEGDTEDFVRTAAGVLKAVDAGAFFPVRGWQCRSCPYFHACGSPP